MPSIDLPWGAWREDGRHTVALPDPWRVDVLPPRDAPGASPEQIRAALEAPVGSRPLGELAQGCRSACVVVDDLARPTRASRILPPLLEQLAAAGLAPEAVRILIATGSHARPEAPEIARKVGDTISRIYGVECHDCRGDLAPTGIAYGPAELHVNATFLRSELKVAMGAVLPHPFASYSGGAKLVLPGLSGLAAIRRSHRYVELGIRGGSDPDTNAFRLEAEAIARQLGVRFAVNVVSNSSREPAHVVAGDLVASHREACGLAREVFRTETAGPYDCLLVNAYPKDIDLIQSESALGTIKNAVPKMLATTGIVVLATSAWGGLGRHGLYEPGGTNYAPPARKPWLRGAELWLYAPGIPADDVHKLFWEGYPSFQSAAELKAALESRLPGPRRAAVLPCAPMQQL